MLATVAVMVLARSEAMKAATSATSSVTEAVPDTGKGGGGSAIMWTVATRGGIAR